MSADPLLAALRDSGGVGAPPSARAQLRRLLLERLQHGAEELARPRSGYELPVLVAVAAVASGALVAVAPVDATVRADPARTSDRGWLVAAAAVGALVEAGGAALRAGSFEGAWLALRVDVPAPDPDLAALAFDERVAQIDRLRALAAPVPAHLLESVEDLREASGQLRAAELVSAGGGDPTDPAAMDGLEDALPPEPARPHDDPLPERRIARRILQRMAGMGKWGGYHTEFTHLARGFEGNDRGLALEIAEKLLGAGLLEEKRSVGQRHVFLNPRRAAEIHALIDDGTPPPGLDL